MNENIYKSKTTQSVKLTEQELKIAYNYWKKFYRFVSLDFELDPYLNERILPFQKNRIGWLKKTRLSLMLSAESVSQKAKVKKSAYSRCEVGEATGSIKLSTLAKLADAMDCELVYAIRPKKRKNYSQIIWEKILPEALVHPWLRACDPKRRGNALGAVARDLMKTPKFRRKKGWSKRT